MTDTEGAARATGSPLTVWIVGKGPSLCNLRAEHIGPGTVLTLNDAIEAVEILNLPNLTYSLQNDGYVHETANVLANAAFDSRDVPHWDARVWGWASDQMVIRVAVAIAKGMGAARIVMVCCDSLLGDMRTWTPSGPVLDGSVGHYGYVREPLMQDLSTIPYEVLTPC